MKVVRSKRQEKMAAAIQPMIDDARAAENGGESIADAPAASLLPQLFSLGGSPAVKSDKGFWGGMQRLNQPQMLKAVEKNGTVNIPVGANVLGVLVDVIPSPVTTVKGNLLWLRIFRPDPANPDGKPIDTGHEITFPATGVIRNALAPGIEGTDTKAGQEKAREIMAKKIGHLVSLTRTPDKLNGKYNKTMGMWDVHVSEKPVAVDLGVKVH